MKTLKIFFLLVMSTSVASIALAQNIKTESIPVSGNCGMCKSTIEKAAKSAGAKEANWNVEKKELTVKYSSSSSNAAKIQNAVAAAGYDTRDVKATKEAYERLHSCCQYDRSAQPEKPGCCSDKCEMKDGKCTNTAACKDKGCCDDEGHCKDSGCCSNEGTNGTKADCCKKTS